MPRKYVIIGAGAAGSAAARTLARLCPGEEILLFSDEPLSTYYRPALPEMLCGRLSLYHLKIADAEHYARLGVTLRSERVQEVDPERQMLKIRGGREETYDRLLLCTGSRPYVNPNWGGRRLAGVFTLRKVEHLYAIQEALAPDTNVIVVGGGLYALQIAQALAGFPVRILMLVRESWVGYPIFTKPQGALLRARIEAAGIEVRTLDEVHEFLGYEGRVIGVRTKAGGMLECGLVVVAQRMIADMRIAQQTLEHGDGFLVDEHYRTSAPNIYAAGDAALPRSRQDAPHWRGWEKAGQEGVRAAYALAEREDLPPPAPTVIAGLSFGLPFLHLGDPPMDVNLAAVEMHKTGDGIAYLTRSEEALPGDAAAAPRGRIRQASLLGYRHCHHALTKVFTSGLDISQPLSDLLDTEFDWQRVSPMLFGQAALI